MPQNRPYQVIAVVTGSYSLTVDANSPEEAELQAEDVISDLFAEGLEDTSVIIQDVLPVDIDSMGEVVPE